MQTKQGAEMKHKIDYSTMTIVDPSDLETQTLKHVQEVRSQVIDLIKERSITKTELAAKMGISKSHLSNILNSQTNLTLETIARFELALGITFELTLRSE